MVAAGEHLSSSRPVRRAKARPAARIPLCVEPPPSFAEGPGPGRDWWEKALSEKSFRAGKHENSQQNQSVGAKSRTTNLGPFGEVIRATGPMAKLNPFRFSTKYQDDESDLVYYGYRYYNASTGRWLSRDPIDEQGGLNPIWLLRQCRNKQFRSLRTVDMGSSIPHRNRRLPDCNRNCVSQYWRWTRWTGPPLDIRRSEHNASSNRRKPRCAGFSTDCNRVSRRPRNWCTVLS